MASGDDPSSPPPTRRSFLRTSAVATAGLLAACGDDDATSTTPDTGAPDGGPPPDLGAPDTATPDAGPADGAVTDLGPPDAGPRDMGPPPDPGTPDAVPESMSFPLGVASGDPTETNVVVWTRYDGTGPLELAVFEMMGDAYLREVLTMAVTPAEGGFVHVDVGGLVAGARYRYAFFEMTGTERTARSLVGRFRTAMAADAVETLVFGACSCTSNTRSLETLEHAGGRDDMTAFLLLGDTTYNDSAETRVGYRAYWETSLEREGYRALRRMTPVLATWDDHEVDNDFNPETLDADRFAAARGAFFEHLPIRRSAEAPDRIWRSFRFGATAEVFVLDCRGERRPSTRDTPAAEYLSRAQMDWLKAGLAASPCVFKLVANSVPISDFPGFFDFAQRDRWEGYPAQREEILRYIDDMGIGGVLWIAGDFHLASIGRVSTSGPGSTALEVLAGPGAQTANALWPMLTAPQFDWASGTNNYTTFELDPTARTVRVRHIAAEGEMLTDRTYEL